MSLFENDISRNKNLKTFMELLRYLHLVVLYLTIWKIYSKIEKERFSLFAFLTLGPGPVL